MKQILFIAATFFSLAAFSQTGIKAKTYRLNVDSLKIGTPLTSTSTSDSVWVYRASDSTMRKMAQSDFAGGGGSVSTTDNNLTVSGSAIGTNKSVQTLTDGTTITWNMANGYNAQVTLGGNRALSITNVQEGDYGTITVFQDGTGGRTLTVTGGTISLNSSANDSTVLSFYYDGNSYVWRDGAKPVLNKAITIESPTSSENVLLWKTPYDLTIVSVEAVLVGSSTPSVTYQIAFGSDVTSTTNVYTAGQTVTSTTTGNTGSGFNDNTIPAGSWVLLKTSAQSGTVASMNVTINYTKD